jgi:hypothetical protein
MSIKEGLTMNKFKLLVVFLLGIVVGAVGLFIFLLENAPVEQQHNDVSTKPAVMSVSTNDGQNGCLADVAQQARLIYADLAVHRGNMGVRIEFERVSPAELKREERRTQELYARIGASLEDCINYGEPVKLDHHVLADMNWSCSHPNDTHMKMWVFFWLLKQYMMYWTKVMYWKAKGGKSCHCWVQLLLLSSAW